MRVQPCEFTGCNREAVVLVGGAYGWPPPRAVCADCERRIQRAAAGLRISIVRLDAAELAS